MAALTAISALPRPAQAQDAPVAVIRDTEIESTIRAYATPLWKAAGLNPDSVRVVLINDPQINAFVAGGQNLFIYTGLLLKSEDAGEVMGVIAHETGHMAGGHLARIPEALHQAMITSLLSYVLGAAAAVATARSGGGNAMGAIAFGGTSFAERSFLAFSRTQEASADSAGVTFLDAIGQSSRGFLRFMELLQGQEYLLPERQDPYIRTHPLTAERIDFLRHHVETSKYSGVPVAPEFNALHRRMVAKLRGFLDAPGAVLARYPATDTSIAARYARAVAYYRIPDLKSAVPLVDGLIKDEPNDPYFYELKGQMMLENSRVAEALEPYRKAAALAPGAPLIHGDLAQVLIELNDPSLLKEAIANLQEATRKEPDVPRYWRQLAIAYGRDNQLGLASLSLAQEAMLDGRTADARDQARRAERLLPANSPGWLRAQDIEGQALRERKEDKKP